MRAAHQANPVKNVVSRTTVIHPPLAGAFLGRGLETAYVCILRYIRLVNGH